MVYRLYRANRFLLARIFIVLLIYSLIIGSIGFLLLGIAINFDNQSFNPQLIDANPIATSISSTTTTTNTNSSTNQNTNVCDNYKTVDCSWYLFSDIKSSADPGLVNKFSGLLLNFANRSELGVGNMLVFQDNFSSYLFLADFVAKIDPNAFVTSTQQTLVQIPENETCVGLISGTNCPGSLNKLRFVPNLNLYENVYGNLTFLGSHVLVNQSNNVILCNTFPQNCQYRAVPSSPGIYTYRGGDSADKYFNTTAFDSIIKPNPSITPNARVLTDALNQTSIVCQFDLNTTNNCKKMAIFEDPGTFLFSNGQNILPGFLQMNQLTTPQNDLIDFKSVLSNSFYCLKVTQYSIFSIQGQIPISCSQYIDTSSPTTQYYTYIDHALSGLINPNSPKLVFKLDSTGIHGKFVYLISTNKGKSSPAILINILSHPKILYESLFKIDVAKQILQVSIVFLLINLLLAFLMIFLRSWRRVGGFIAPKTTLTLRGRFGSLLELTQFFDFGGSWYLEVHSVNDYNFKSTRGVIHELVRERWRDTIFFPTSLAASISIVIFSLYSSSTSIYSLFAVGGVLPLLLAFWIPALWVIEDSGLKRAEWSSNGELLTIQKISVIVRDGFNKLIGFGAIFGIGTAGASIFRAKITGSSVSSTSAISGSIDNLLSLNYNFLVSAILWTAALLFIVTAVSLTGNVITALSYLNTDHLANVKKMRTRLQQKEIFLGTTQQSMDYARSDESIYFDSKQGIDSAIDTQFVSKKSQQMPDNKIITGYSLKSEDDLTQIVITNPKDIGFEVQKVSDDESTESEEQEASESESFNEDQQTDTKSSEEIKQIDADSSEDTGSMSEESSESGEENDKENSDDENSSPESTETKDQIDDSSF